ncbi:hydrogen peroxide-inducible genes activator [bacterium]|nr:hydrogen peroxide-inducible genes activator [bacterium]
MTLTELRYLVALDTERHFGRAAERSFVSQPSLSVALRKLEDQLGVTLFERARGEAKPTPVGERIIEQARVVLAEAATIEAIAQAGQDELAGPLRLGAIYTVGPYLLPHLVPKLRELAPKMPLVIEENFTVNLLQQLKNNDLDVVLIALPIDQPGVDTWPVYDEDFAVVMPEAHAWAQRDAVPSRELAGEHLLLLGPGHCFRDQVVEACPECTDYKPGQPRPQTGSSLETIRHMVASGLGITVLPQSSLQNRPDDPAALVARPLESPVPTRRIALAWRRQFPRGAAVSQLRDAVLQSGMAGVRWLDVPRGG